MTPALERLRCHLEALETGHLTVRGRLDRWRLIRDVAVDAHEQEVRLLDELNVVMADPALEVPIA